MPPLTREQLAARRGPNRQRVAQRRRRRRTLTIACAPLLVVGLIALVLGLTSGGSDPGQAAGIASPVVAASPGTGDGPPSLVIARAEGVEIQLPVQPERLTAVGFHPLDTATIPLEPTDSVEHGELSRQGRDGPQTASVDVGAPAGTPVYAPVDGVITGVSDYVVRGSVEGYEIGIEPAAAPGLVVRMSHVEPYPPAEPVEVGEAVTAGETIVGQVRDFSEVAEQQLSELTSDSGNHVNIDLVPSRAPALP